MREIIRVPPSDSINFRKLLLWLKQATWRTKIMLLLSPFLDVYWTMMPQIVTYFFPFTAVSFSFYSPSLHGRIQYVHFFFFGGGGCTTFSHCERVLSFWRIYITWNSALGLTWTIGFTLKYGNDEKIERQWYVWYGLYGIVLKTSQLVLDYWGVRMQTLPQDSLFHFPAF